MKVCFRKLRWTLPALVALSAGPGAIPSAAQAPQPVGQVELAEPIGAGIEPQPLPAGPYRPMEPTPAAPAGEPSPTAGPRVPRPLISAAPPTESLKPVKTLTVSDDPVAAEAPPPAEDQALVELIKERYPSGAIKVEREVTQDADGNYLLHGAWRQYDDQGRLMAEGRYVRNRKDGLWRRFYRAGETPLLGTAPYKEFEAPFVSQATFRSGTLQGKWTIADAKQRKVHDVEFADGQRHGRATWYFPTGAVLLQANYVRGRIHGDVVKFSSDAQVVAEEQYDDGRQQGTRTEFYDTNKKVKKTETGYLHAPLVISKLDDFDAGTLAAFETRGDDEKHGSFQAWHENGQVAKRGEFRYGLPVGKVTHWFANGQKQMEGQYIDGRQHGTWTWWHENGQKAVTGEYRDGTAVNQWSWWQATGKLAQRADLSEGQPVISAPTLAQPPPGSSIRSADRPSLDPVLPRR
jgi:uncharacterized protein